MGNCCASSQTLEEDHEDDHGEQPIDIRFSNTSADGNERPTRSTIRTTRGQRGSGDFGPPVGGGRYGSSRGVPSPSCSSVSLVPVARTGSYDVRVASRTRQNGGDGVIETSRLVIDHLKGNVFINQYLIIKDLGKGAHGTVKLVYNTQDDMLYAMKVIHKRRMRRQSYLAEPRAVANMMRNVGMSPLSQSQTEGHRGMSPLASPRTPNSMTDEYSNEIAVMKELDHPNVVKLYEVIHDPSNNKLLMTMEYVEGGCVLAGSSPTQKVPIPESTAVKYFRDVVKGLEYLHFNRIVHGDLKPDNLLMSSSGKVKISDFGSARFCEKSDMIFATAGTPTFMAPEMCQGKQFNGFPGDIWALGICLFMFVFGKPPFVGSTTYQIYEAIQRAEVVFPSEVPADEELKDLLERLLQKDPGQRISLEEIPAHPWVTRGGALPVLQTSNERAVQRVFEAMRKRNESGGRRVEPSTVPLAAPLEPVDMRKLVPDAEVRHYKDGEVIITQGHIPEGLYYVQDGYVDMVMLPSEKKLVADEDFADAIDDEEDEDDEAVVTATANVLDNRRSNGSGGDDGDDGSEEGTGEGEEEGAGQEKGVDDFMALFGSRLSDRVSPLGSSPTVTPRNHSAAVTPRHGSQTLAPRNHSTTLAPRYASQSLMAGRRPHLSEHHLIRASNGGGYGSEHHLIRASNGGGYGSEHHLVRASNGGAYGGSSASTPLPPSLQPHHSSPAGNGYSHHHLPSNLGPLAPSSPGRSHSRSPHSSNNAGHSTGVHSPRQHSHTTSTRLAQSAAITQQQQNLSNMVNRISLNGGGGMQLRVQSYSGGAGMMGVSSPSPLGLSCSNAADLLGEELTRDPPRNERISVDNTTDGEADSSRPSAPAAAPPLDLLRPSASARDPAQSPFLVPSPSMSPQTSRRQLTQEPSFNPRVQRGDSGRRQPSRLSGTDSFPVGSVAASPPARIALLGRAASNRARSSIDSEEGTGHHDSHKGSDAAGGTSTSRRSASLLGPHGAAGAPPTSSPSGDIVSGPTFQPHLPPAGPSSSHKDKENKGKEGKHSKDKDRDKDGEDVLFLSPSESRRLSVTAGGKNSFRLVGGALGGGGVLVSPTGQLGSLSPAASISRVHSAEQGNRPAPGLSLAFSAAAAGSSGGAAGDEGASDYKADSADSVLSNADISMQVRPGWRRERPAPVQVGGTGMPGSIVPQLGPRAPSGDGHAALDAMPLMLPLGLGSGVMSGSSRSPMRRSVTHSEMPSMDLEPDRSSTRISPGYGPAEKVITSAAVTRHRGHDSMRGMEEEDAARAARAQEEEDEEEEGGDAVHSMRGTPEEELRQLPRHAYTDVGGTRGPPPQPPLDDYEGNGAYGSAQPLARFKKQQADQGKRGRMRRHSTSSYNATNILTRVLGVSTGGAPLDRSSIQEWSTTSKLAQKAIQRSDSMHSRMAQMVLRAKQHAVRRKRRGSMQLVTTRGPGSVVGELCIDGKPAPSISTVVAKGPVTLLLIKNEKVTKYRNQPSVMAALHRSQNASLVQEAMERFVECEQEVVAVEVIRRTITTEPNMHLDMPDEEEDDYTGEYNGEGERVSSERLMADIYNA